MVGAKRVPAEKLSLSQPNRQSKLEMFQHKVEELFFFQTGAFIVTSWWEVMKSRSQPVIYSDLPLAHILCPAVPFNTAPALECLLPNISSTICSPIRRALLRLVPGRALPALQRECQLRSSVFANQTDNLSLRWCSRKSKNYSFSRLVCLHCYVMVGGDRVPSNPTIVLCLLPADAQLCLSTLHQHLSAFCQIFQAQYASPSAEHC